MTFRLLRGPRLIAAVIATFENLLKHIERGILHTREEIVSTTTRIEELESHARTLTAHAERGEKFAAKIREFVAYPSSNNRPQDVVENDTMSA